MDTIEEFVDERLKAWCIHCGQAINSVSSNRDHVPTKGILVPPVPQNLPVVQVCEVCNSGFSLDEEYVIGFLGAVLAGTVEPSDAMPPKAASILGRNAKLRDRIARAAIAYECRSGERQSAWRPEVERVNRVVLKNARGHVFYEVGEPMLDEPVSVWALPLASLTTEQLDEFNDLPLTPGWPEVGSRMMTRMLTGQDLESGWIVVQPGVYRYTVVQGEGTLVRTVLFEYLATEVRWSH